MRTRSDNIRTSRGEHALLWIAPSALVLVALSAVVSRDAPGAGLDAPEFGAARLRVEQCDARRAELAEFERSGGIALLRTLQSAADASVPESIAPVEVQAHVRLLARASGFELEGLDLAEARKPEHEIAAGGVEERPLVVRGRGRVERLPEFVAALRELGHPLAVDALEVDGAVRDDGRFHFRVELGLFQRAKPVPVQTSVPIPEGTNP